MKTDSFDCEAPGSPLCLAFFFGTDEPCIAKCDDYNSVIVVYYNLDHSENM